MRQRHTFYPAFHVLEGVDVGDVVHEDGSTGPAIVPFFGRKEKKEKRRRFLNRKKKGERKERRDEGLISTP